jgi:CheY-like chemotaxis protein
MNFTNILLVEDDYLDVIDIRRSLDKINVLYNLQIAKNGEEAIEMLDIASETGPSTMPDIVLIDINMPKMNGLELLGEIRKHPKWKDLKCFIITTSDEKIDRQTARELGVSGYIIKPLKLNGGSIDAFNLMIDLMNNKSQ